MLRKAALVLFVSSFALPAAAQDKPARIPKNTINCAQFKKSGQQEWIENGTAVFNLGSVDDINLTNQPVTPGYFRFDGIDLFPVLEQKCGAPATEAPPMASAALAVGTQTAIQKPEPEQEKTPIGANEKPAPVLMQESTSLAATRNPAPSLVNDSAPPLPAKHELDQKCQDQKSVYSANSLAEGAEDRAVVEIALDSKANGEGSPDFILRESKGGEIQWAYKGRTRQSRFIFTGIPHREVHNQGRFAFAPVSTIRNESVALQSSFIKPNRDGSGEAILTVHGLRTLFASKEDSRRFKFEGKRPVELLPEAFYFDRCE